MSAARQRRFRRLMPTAVGLIAAGALVTGCTSNTPDGGNSSGGNTTVSDNAQTGPPVSDNGGAGDPAPIGFSAPAADHGWIAGITDAAKAAADQYDDVDLQVA